MSDIAPAIAATSRVVGGRLGGPEDALPHAVATTHVAITHATRAGKREECTNCCNGLRRVIGSPSLTGAIGNREEYRRHAARDTLETHVTIVGTLTV